jgi:hypothetical protein
MITIGKYKIDEPTENGYAFWSVFDSGHDMILASIYKDVPNAKEICLMIVRNLQNA